MGGRGAEKPAISTIRDLIIERRARDFLKSSYNDRAFKKKKARDDSGIDGTVESFILTKPMKVIVMSSSQSIKCRVI